MYLGQRKMVLDCLTQRAIRLGMLAHSAWASLLSTEGMLGLSHTMVGFWGPLGEGMEAPEMDGGVSGCLFGRWVGWRCVLWEWRQFGRG